MSYLQLESSIRLHVGMATDLSQGDDRYNNSIDWNSYTGASTRSFIEFV